MRKTRRAWMLCAMVTAAGGVAAPQARAVVTGSSTGTALTISDSGAAPTANTITGFGCIILNDIPRITVALNGGIFFINQPGGCGVLQTISISMGIDADSVTPSVSAALSAVQQVLVDGGDGNDHLVGANKPVVLTGGPGDDLFDPTLNGTQVNGQDGTDTLRATGFDYTLTDTTLTGVPATTFSSIERAELTGNDRSADTIDASAFSGAVVLNGLDNADHLLAGSGGGSLIGGPGNDDLDGGAGADIVEGGDGNDALAGGGGNDRLIPGAGDDTVAGDAGADTVEAAADADLVLTPTALTGVGADALATIESAALAVGPGAHTIDVTAFPGATRLTGGPGSDVLLGGPGPDTIRGGDGDDLVRGNLGPDDLGGDGGSDRLSYAGYANPVVVTLGAPSGGPAVDPDTLAADFEHVEGGSAADRLTGDNTPNVLTGGPGDDVLDGRAAADVHDGGIGNDALLGGPGGPGDGDVHIGGDGIDMVTYAGRTGGVRVTVGAGADDGSPGEGDDVRADIETVVGSQADDVIVAAPAPPATAASLRLVPAVRPFLVAGLAGADRIIGGIGNDALGGGLGADTIEGGPGNDVVAGGSGIDLLKGLAGNDRLYGHAGADKIEGGDGDDVVFSLDKSLDRIRCGLGTDLLLADVRDIPALARLAALKPTSKLRPSRRPLTIRSDCDRSIGKTGTPSAPGATPPGGNQTCDDGDDIWGDEGDTAGCEEPTIPGEPDPPGGWTEETGTEFSDLVNGFGEDINFDNFGEEFDDSFFGSGFDDFGDAFGEDLGGTGSDATGPKVATRSARLDRRRRAGLRVSCPKRATGRCIGELSLQRPPQGRRKAALLGRALFSIARGKKKTLRIRLTSTQAKRLTRSKKGTPAEAIVEARDSGTNLWQSTATVKLRRR